MTAMSSADRAVSSRQGWVLATKVPEITLWFWIAKVASTGMGEAAADFGYLKYGTVADGAFGAILLIVALALQFRTRSYNTWIYWLAVVAVSVAGTMAADGLHIVVGLPYTVTTVLYAGILAAIFVIWYMTEGTLSIHSITTVRREAFYWATVMATFALGTALGDLTAYTLKIGFFFSFVLFLVVIAIPALRTGSLAWDRCSRSGSPTPLRGPSEPHWPTGLPSSTGSAGSAGAAAPWRSC